MHPRLLNVIPLLLLAGLAQPRPASAQIAQEAVDLSVVQQIREEGLERSQIEAMARHLTEVIGPTPDRLTRHAGRKRVDRRAVRVVGSRQRHDRGVG